MIRVVVLDYGSGNLRSAQRALERVGAEVSVTAETDAARDADGLLVPGVGAFSTCVRGLRAVGGDRVVADRLRAQRPVLGICVGMQILFERGVEHEVVEPGCGQWPGAVERLQADVLPHMGWNEVDIPTGSTLFAGIDRGTRFYFVHSFAALQWHGDAEAVVTRAQHGEEFIAAVENGLLAATQFHPEKSADAGAQLLENWVGSLK